MRFFPSSLTKNAFTWLSSLRPNSIHLWLQLKKSFHEQFFRGQIKISLTNLFSIRWFQGESINDYLTRFRNMKNRCFTPVPEAEVVEMAMNGLDYKVRKKIVNQQFFELAQLVEKFRQIEQLRAEKERINEGSKQDSLCEVRLV